MSLNMNWIAITSLLPKEKQVVLTKIDDRDGTRNEQKLLYYKNLWWLPDMSMYVYYRPTHWKSL